MSSFTIDKRLEAAIVATLAANAGVLAIGATVVKGGTAAAVQVIPAPGQVGVYCTGMANGPLGLHGVQIASPAFLSIVCLTRTSQDLTGEDVQNLAAAVEDALADEAIVTTLNAAASGLNIYANGLHLVDRSRDDGDGYRQITITLQIHATVTN